MEKLKSKDGKRIIRIALVGPITSGKTALFNRLTGRGFSGHTLATIGINFELIEGSFEQIGEEIIVQMWDTAGHEGYLGMIAPIVKTTDEWKLDNCEKIIVGNKCDLEEKREVSTLKGSKLAFEHGVKFYEVSAKANTNVQEAFNTLLRDIITRIYGKKVTVPEEIELDPYALQLYEKALQAGTEKDKSIRVNIVGNFRQGKTTLMKRLLGLEVKGITSTNGITVEHYKCEKTKDGNLRFTSANDIDEPEYVERLLSVAMSEEIKGEKQQRHSAELNALQKKKSKSLEDQQSHQDAVDTPRYFSSDTKGATSNANDTIGNAMQEKETKVQEGPPSHNDIGHIQNTLFSDPIRDRYNANKLLSDGLNKVSVLSPEEKGVFVKGLKTNNLLSQSLRQTEFDIWDFGGQYIFYATHTIFHSKRAIYLLVFDLSLDLNECITGEQFPVEMEARNMKYFVQFWMSSIHSFVGSADGSVPKVILVGTHKDKLKGKKHEREQYIQKYFMDIREMFDRTNMSYHIHSEEFAVDNTNAKDPSLNSLRETIIRIGDEQSEAFEMPLKWIQLEKSLLERKHLKLISLKFVLAIDSQNEFPLGDMEQVKLFLRYHHSKGTFIYFDEEPISESVVLDPQYLIDAFKCIITSDRFCTTDPDIRPLWNMLLKEGRLEKYLIDRQWGKPKDKFKMYKENKEILLSFLVKHHILSEALAFDENTQQSAGLGWFVVPSLLKDHSSRTEFEEFLNGKKQTKLRYVLLFSISPVLPTIYHRLVSATIGKWPIAKAGKKPLIFKDINIVRLDIAHAGIVEMKHNSIEMTVVSLCPTTNVNGEQADTFRRFLEAVIANEFQKLRSTEETLTKPYTIWFRCNHEEHGEDGSENLIAVEDMEVEKVVPCPDLKNHDINVEKAKEEWFQDNKRMTDIPDSLLTDKLLNSLSQCIGENWQLLGLELGLTQVQIDQIFEDHPHNVVMRKYMMLQRWFRGKADKATLKVLVETVQRCQHVHVDWDKLRNIIDKLN